MIRYYLGEEPILKNAPTYLPFYEEDREYCLANIERLVIKDVAEAGGYGVLFGKDLNQEELEVWKVRIQTESRRFILQEVIDFIDLPVLEDGTVVERKCDLRAFVISSTNGTKVWHSGLTRFSASRIRSSLTLLKAEALKTHGFYLDRKRRKLILARPLR